MKLHALIQKLQQLQDSGAGDFDVIVLNDHSNEIGEITRRIRVEYEPDVEKTVVFIPFEEL